ncbi:hypothetical protein [Streptomyces puniciscabiei]|uniref:hypothetical protein n=1 Tax=Streptomyces puniciscabiei TaxID=164348 RepID=UPI00332372B3
MSVVPRDVVRDLSSTQHRLRYADDCGLKGDLLYNLHSQELITLLTLVTKSIADHPLGRWCQRFVTDVTVLSEQAPAGRGSIVYLASIPLTIPGDLWQAAPLIAELRETQQTWSHGHPRRKSMLAAAGLPLWVLEQLSTADIRDLQGLTAKALVERATEAGISSRGLLDPAELEAQADTALRLLRVLMVLALVRHQLLSSWLAADDAALSHPPDPPIPERPCRPPGAQLVTGPRVPRAPGSRAPHGHCRKGPLPTIQAAQREPTGSAHGPAYLRDRAGNDHEPYCGDHGDDHRNRHPGPRHGGFDQRHAQ